MRDGIAPLYHAKKVRQASVQPKAIYPKPGVKAVKTILMVVHDLLLRDLGVLEALLASLLAS